MAAGGKFADGAYSAAFFHLFNAEFEFVFNNKTYTGFKSDTATLEASLGGSYQMEKNGKYLGHCHAEVQHFTDAPNSDTLLGGMPTLAELVDAGVELDAVAFSTFSKPDGTRYNGRSTSGGYDHSVMVSVRREQVTMKPNFFRRIFGAKPIIQTVTKVDIYENYHINGNPETPLGLTPRRNINYATYAEGTGSVPLRLATNRPPR